MDVGAFLDSWREEDEYIDPPQLKLYTNWALKRKEKKFRKEHNRLCSTLYLNEHGIQYKSFNKGGHLVITHNAHIIDFWPSTGKWVVRSTKQAYRGIKELVLWMSM
jgi:predicted Ser/Thr protein kinase